MPVIYSQRTLNEAIAIKMFNKQPSIKGSSISVKPLITDDFDGLFSCGGDKRVWAGHPSPDRYEKDNFEKWFSSALSSQAALTVVCNKTQEIIGSTRYYFEETPVNAVSIGYTFLAYKCWGGLINRELKSLMLDHAFDAFDSVWFHVSPLNIRSQSAVLKIGAKHYQDKVVSLGGGDIILWKFYKINRQDWLIGK